MVAALHASSRLFRRPEAGASNSGAADISRPLAEKFGDFGTPEQHVPDAKMDWETCMTMNNTWGFSEHDHNWKSPQTIIRTLIDIPAFDGRITVKGKVHYLHLFSRPAGGIISITIPGSTATLMEDGQSLMVTRDDKQTIMHLPKTLPDPVATVIRLE